MKRLLGLDTEYGLLIEGADVRDLVDEARALVQCWPGAWAGPWDYSGEQPLQDLRGFTADHLNEDPQDAQYDRPPARPMARSEERSDRVLQNGARLSAEDLLAFCQPHLARYKIPKSFVFVNELPKSAVGKILRKELRSMDQAKTQKK